MQTSQHGRSLSSIESLNSSAKVHRHRIRSFSASSRSSTNSAFPLRIRQASTARCASLSSMLKPDAISPGEHIYTGLSDVEEREASPSLEGWATFEAKSIRQSMDEIEPVKGWDAASVDSAISVEPKPFHRWVSTLRRRKLEEPATVTPRAQRWTLDDFDALPQSPPFTRPSQHQKSNSWASSFGFVATVRSATATIAAASIASVSRRTSRAQRHRHNSSAFSGSQPRPSCDTERSLMDEAARQRACRRREKVEELIRTEEGYVADLKALSNVPASDTSHLTGLISHVLGSFHPLQQSSAFAGIHAELCLRDVIPAHRGASQLTR